MQHTPYQIPQWKDPQPYFCTEYLSEGRDWDQVSTSAIISTPSTTTIASLAWPSSHTKDQGCDTQIMLPGCWYLLTSLALHHLVVHLGGAGWRCPLPPLISVQRGAQTLMSSMSQTLTSKTFDPIVVMSLVFLSIVALTPGIMLISITIP